MRAASRPSSTPRCVRGCRRPARTVRARFGTSGASARQERPKVPLDRHLDSGAGVAARDERAPMSCGLGQELAKLDRRALRRALARIQRQPCRELLRREERDRVEQQAAEVVGNAAARTSMRRMPRVEETQLARVAARGIAADDDIAQEQVPVDEVQRVQARDFARELRTPARAPRRSRRAMRRARADARGAVRGPALGSVRVRLARARRPRAAAELGRGARAATRDCAPRAPAATGSRTSDAGCSASARNRAGDRP